MRIGLVTTEFVTEKNFDGGLSNYLYRFALSLLKFGHYPIVFVTSDQDGSLFYNGIEVHRVQNKGRIGYVDDVFRMIYDASPADLRTPFNWLYGSYYLNQRVREEHRKEPFSIIQYTNVSATSLFAPDGIPKVMRLSSYRPIVLEAQGREDSPGKELMIKLELKSFERVDAIYSPSRLIAERVAKDTNRQINVIESPFLIETNEWDPNIYHQIFRNKRYLLYFGTLSRAKGVHIIAETLPELLGKYPDLYFVFIGRDFWGHEKKKMADLLMEKAGRHSNRVVRLESLKHDQLYPIIKGAEAIVLPSLADNLPNACIEAMGLGKIVVGTNGSSFEQLIEDGQNGFLVEIGNKNQLLHTIFKVLEMPQDTKNEIEKRARLRIEKLHPQKVVPEILAYYQEIIDRKNL